MGMVEKIVTIKQPKSALHSAEKEMTEIAAKRRMGNGPARLYAHLAPENAATLLTNNQCTFVNFSGRTKCFRCQTPQIGMSDLGIPSTLSY